MENNYDVETDISDEIIILTINLIKNRLLRRLPSEFDTEITNIENCLPIDIPKKLFLIGAGELGCELFLTGTCHYDWMVGSVHSSDDGSAIEKICSLKRFNLLKFQQNIGNFHTSEIENKISYKIEELGEGSKVTVLEDVFLTPDRWINLCDKHKEISRYNNIYIPSKNDAAIFLDKFLMKRKIKEILGDDYQLDFHKISLELNKSNIQKCNRLLNIHNELILKPTITSSGWGQSVIKDLHYDFSRAIELSKRLSRINSGEAIFEQRLGNYNEAAVINFRSIYNLSDQGVIMGPFEYKKEVLNPIGGPIRLKEVFYPARNKKIRAVIEHLKSLTLRINDKIKSPFLCVEFLINGDQIFINEINWRPEDVGMITLLSHKKDQYNMFLECFEKKYIDNEENNGNFTCFSIKREEQYPHSPSEKFLLDEGENYKIHFYHKPVPISFTHRVPNQRIVGYGIAKKNKIEELRNYLKEKIEIEFGDEEDTENSFIF